MERGYSSSLRISRSLHFSTNNTFFVLELVGRHSLAYTRSQDLLTALCTIKDFVIRALRRASGSDLILYNTDQFRVGVCFFPWGICTLYDPHNPTNRHYDNTNCPYQIPLQRFLFGNCRISFFCSSFNHRNICPAFVTLIQQIICGHIEQVADPHDILRIR